MAAEQKKSKVLSNAFNRTWDWQGNTMYSHNIKFENGDSGQANFKTQNDTYFQVGKEVEYGIEGTPRKDDPLQTNWKISKPKKPFTQGGGGAAPKGIKEYKAEVVLVAMKNAAQVIAIRDDLTDKDFKQYLKAFISAGVAELKTHWVE